MNASRRPVRQAQQVIEETSRRSWEKLASDYNILRGGLLPFGLLVLMFAPWIVVRIRA